MKIFITSLLLSSTISLGFTETKLQEKNIKKLEYICKASKDPATKKRACENLENSKAVNMFLSSVKTDTKSN